MTASSIALVTGLVIETDGEKMIDDFVKESRASRKVFVDAVEIMSRRLDKVEDTVGDIKNILKERS